MQVGERERVELAVRERKALGARLDELDAAVRPCPGLTEHLGALVDADDRAALLPHELARDHAGPRGDVENAVARAGLDARDEEPAPAGILAVREQGRVALVGRADRRKQLPGLHRSESRLLAWR